MSGLEKIYAKAGQVVDCWKCGAPTTSNGAIWFCECGAGWMRSMDDSYLIRTNRPPPGVVAQLIAQAVALEARRLATGYEKRGANYRAMWIIAATILWL